MSICKRVRSSAMKWLVGAMAMVALLVAPGSSALGFELGETKEELGLDYEVALVDHGTGRVTVTVSIADVGRLAPLSAVQLMVADEDGPNEDGASHVDLAVAIEMRNEDGRQVGRVHVRRDWAERGAISLQTRHLDGEETPLTWYYHSIRMAEYLEQHDRAAADAPDVPDSSEAPAAGPPASDAPASE